MGADRMSIKEQIEKLRKTPKGRLDEVVAELVTDNENANKVLSSLQQQQSMIAQRIAEQVGICNYTAAKAVERHNKLTKPVEPTKQPESVAEETAADRKADAARREYFAEKRQEEAREALLSGAPRDEDGTLRTEP